MTPSDQSSDAVAGPHPQRASTTVSALVSRLDGIEQMPLPAQAEVLDAVRRGLDEVLARPAVEAPTAPDHPTRPVPGRHG